MLEKSKFAHICRTSETLQNLDTENLCSNVYTAAQENNYDRSVPESTTERSKIDPTLALRPGEYWLLDAPGNFGITSRSPDRVLKYIESGGRIICKIQHDCDGRMIFLDVENELRVALQKLINFIWCLAAKKTPVIDWPAYESPKQFLKRLEKSESTSQTATIENTSQDR